MNPEMKLNYGDDVEELDFYVNDIKKFHTKQFISKFVLKNMGEYPEWRFMEILGTIIDRAYKHSIQDGNSQLFTMLLNSEELDTPIYIPLRSREQNSVNLIINEIDKLEMSEKKWRFMNSIISIIITLVSPHRGNGPSEQKKNPCNYFRRKRNQVLRVENEDKFCLFYALELGRLYHDGNIIHRIKQKNKPIPPGLLTYQSFGRLQRDRERLQKHVLEFIKKNKN
jgi:hypothetical protein